MNTEELTKIIQINLHKNNLKYYLTYKINLRNESNF